MQLLDSIETMRFIPWPAKPRCLADLDILADRAQRQVEHVNLKEVEEIRARVYASIDVKDYMERISGVISRNFGNYFWLLELHIATAPDHPKGERIGELLDGYRQNYRPDIIKNLPATQKMLEDMRRHRDVAEAEDPLVEAAKDVFDGREVR
ncbi:MAG: hypothetical protein WC450_10880 [Candidatus Omnitrophota bacterium]|jgi:hypothetical protein